MASHYTMLSYLDWTHDGYLTVSDSDTPALALIERIQFQHSIAMEPQLDTPIMAPQGQFVAYRIVDVPEGNPVPEFSANPLLSPGWDEANVIDWVGITYWSSVDHFSGSSTVTYATGPILTGVYDVNHHVPAGNTAWVQIALWDGTSTASATGLGLLGGVRMWVRHNVQ